MTDPTILDLLRRDQRDLMQGCMQLNTRQPHPGINVPIDFSPNAVVGNTTILITNKAQTEPQDEEVLQRPTALYEVKIWVSSLQVARAMLALPTRQRLCVLLRTESEGYLGELTLDETEECLTTQVDVPTGTYLIFVVVRSHRGLILVGA